jgi:hypothetical protein
MATPGRLDVSLELEVGSEPIQGLISAEGQPSRRFTGWLELTSRLVGLMNSATTESDGERPETSSARRE